MNALDHLLYQCLDILMILTIDNITGTSTKTPTTVAKAAPELIPKRVIAVATDNSKKLLAPIIAAGEAIDCSK